MRTSNARPYGVVTFVTTHLLLLHSSLFSDDQWSPLVDSRGRLSLLFHYSLVTVRRGRRYFGASRTSHPTFRYSRVAVRRGRRYIGARVVAISVLVSSLYRCVEDVAPYYNIDFRLIRKKL